MMHTYYVDGTYDLNNICIINFTQSNFPNASLYMSQIQHIKCMLTKRNKIKD